MTFVSNGPSWWPLIDLRILYSYWTVAAGVVVVYDWVLTLGQEIDLIWRQRWSLMTALYLAIRYIGIPYSVYVTRPKIGVLLIRSSSLMISAKALVYMPLVPLTDAVSYILGSATNGTTVSMSAMLGVIMIARLHAMYQGSRIMLIFLVIVFLTVNIACVVLAAIGVKYVVADELIIYGIHMCGYYYEGDASLLYSMVWMLNTVWEVLALCLSVWIAVKHFRDLRRLRPSTGSTIGDCFKALIKSHVLYFASFAGVSCFQLIDLSPAFWHSDSTGVLTFAGVLQILAVVQMFVLGPRLILSVREFHAKLVADSDAETSMDSIVFQEHVHVSTSSTV
ncbi:hypothetical protein EDD22DRAFT_144870 [Suillus occidentalis]|nr:hypothetical protein EDD22DRAFT_144870 [Suillus occidentalis]